MARNTRTDSGIYNRPAVIEKPSRTDDGQGGSSPAWTTVCSPMVHRYSGIGGRGSSRPFFAGQLYPTARHYAAMRWRSDVVIDGTMTMLLDGRRYQILDAIDPDMEHVEIVMPLVEYQAQGTKKVS